MDNEQEQGQPVRRISQRDRKRRIESRDLSFPPDDLPIEAPPEPPANDETQDLPSPPRRERAERPARQREQPPAPRRPASPPAPSRRAPARRRRISGRDVIAALFGLLTCGAIAWFAYIWNNPYSPLNPLSPPILPPVVVSETPLPTATSSPTPRPTAVPSATFTPLPIDQINAPVGSTVSAGTPDLTLTLLAGTPSATPPPPPFALLRTGIVYTTHAGTEGCAYSGIAGSVVDFDGQPLNGYTVWITGETVDSRLITGSSNFYGAGGFLLQVGDTAETKPYAAQVLAQDGITPLSEPVTFLTRDVCEFNVALVRFVQVREIGGN